MTVLPQEHRQDTGTGDHGVSRELSESEVFVGEQFDLWVSCSNWDNFGCQLLDGEKLYWGKQQRWKPAGCHGWPSLAYAGL